MLQIRKTKFDTSDDSSSTSSSDDSLIVQQHMRVLSENKLNEPTAISKKTLRLVSETAASIPKVSLASIARIRKHFGEIDTKMRILRESLNTCHTIATDSKVKMSSMAKKFHKLKRKEKLKRESNYSMVINKNKQLAMKTKHDIKKLQMCGTEEEMREVAARICKNYLYGAWKTVNPKELNFKRISGGLSNFLYYVALPEKKKSNIVNFHESENALDFDTDGSRMFRSNSFTMDEPKKVLLRIYGQVHGDRAMDAIVTESVIFTLLSERRLGPKLYGVFSGGRIEEFIPARPLTTRELGEPALSMKIAEKMAAIHTMDIPLSKEPNWIWKTMSKWIKAIKEERKTNTYEAKNDLEKNIIKELNEVDFDQEFEWLKKFIVAVNSPVVFCHNDMQEGNILSYDDSPTQPTSDDEGTSPVYVQTYSDLTRSQHRQHRSVKDIESFDDAVTSDSIISGMSDSGEPQLVFIDFEYCAYNYRGFDIANHFQEWRYDYTNPDYPFYHELLDNMPSLEQKEIFIKEYLKHSNSSQTEDRPLHTPTIDEINKLFAEVDAFALASHLFWSIWSVLNASKSQIPFGYWPYALSRYEVYRNLKQEVIKKESFGIAQKRKICEVDI